MAEQWGSLDTQIKRVREKKMEIKTTEEIISKTYINCHNEIELLCENKERWVKIKDILEYIDNIDYLDRENLELEIKNLKDELEK